MIRGLAACATTAALTFAVTMALTSPHHVAAAAAGAPSGFAPPCEHAGYGADGNMSPLFCVIDNPVALHATPRR